MASNLREKPAVAPLVQQAAWVRALHRQAAEDEGPRGEPERLVRGFSLFPNEFDYLGAAKLLL